MGGAGKEVERRRRVFDHARQTGNVAKTCRFFDHRPGKFLSLAARVSGKPTISAPGGLFGTWPGIMMSGSQTPGSIASSGAMA